MDLVEWRKQEAVIAAYQTPDGRPLVERLPSEWLASLTDLEALSLKYDPRAYLRPRQQAPDAGGDWIVWLMVPGRGWGKSHAAAAYFVGEVMRNPPDAPATFALLGPTEPEAWAGQWSMVEALTPPWVRFETRVSKKEIVFPDYGVRVMIRSAEDTEFRGPNLRLVWGEELVKWHDGARLWRNVRRSLRVRGDTPPRAVLTTTPPEELDWIIDLAADPATYVTRGRMRDNTALDPRAVEAEYRASAGTSEGERELDGACVFGVDGALFFLERREVVYEGERFVNPGLDATRLPGAPKCDEVVVAVDPSQSGKGDADPVGIVACGRFGGHLCALESLVGRMAPEVWASKAIGMADRWRAGRFIVEPTGSGSYPRSTLAAQMQIMRSTRRPVIESPARGSKADRAQPLALAAARERFHIVGKQKSLEHDMCRWYPGAKWSPNGLDALVHGCAALTSNWRMHVT